jgi:hypothetical protein
MEKAVLNSRQISQLKLAAKSVDLEYQKMIKLNEQILKLEADRNAIKAFVNSVEKPFLERFGYTPTQLIKKEITVAVDATGNTKRDKNGYPVKVTKFVLRYPDTIFPTESDSNGSDFDIDSTVDKEEEVEEVKEGLKEAEEVRETINEAVDTAIDPELEKL